MRDTTKQCGRCKEDKLLENFYKRPKRKDYYHYCKGCSIAQTVERQRRFKQQCVNYKGGSCELCGYSNYIGALEFHHRDPTQKDFTISSNRSTSFKDKTKLELDKCLLLCANCHREKHAELLEEKSWSSQIRTIEELRVIKEEKASSRYSHCIDCGVKVYKSSLRCKKCSNIQNNTKRDTKITWPNSTSLLNDANEVGYRALGRKLGVSDTAIRKRIKAYPPAL